jgi:hypothetical protein
MPDGGGLVVNAKTERTLATGSAANFKYGDAFVGGSRCAGRASRQRSN